jgi:hypothetical protein
VDELANEPFALLGVNSDALAEARQAVARNKLNWRSFQDRPAGSREAISDAWGVRGWPTLVVLDGERRIHYRGHDARRATKVVRDLLAAKKAPGGG